jgi:phosphatidylglycerophosphate synthase
MNLPNAITVTRILCTPLIAWLPFVPSWPARLAGFVIFLAAAITDWWDGHLARSRNLVTDLGRLLDPLADKLLLASTLIPMFILQRDDGALWTARGALLPTQSPFLFDTPIGHIALPLWMVIVVLGREFLMTVFRQVAAKRGLVIAAIGPAKLKTTFQNIWIGAAYFWFFVQTLGEHTRWNEQGWFLALAWFPGIVGTVSMVVATALTVWSLGLYLTRYGPAVVAARPSA